MERWRCGHALTRDWPSAIPHRLQSRLLDRRDSGSEASDPETAASVTRHSQTASLSRGLRAHRCPSVHGPERAVLPRRHLHLVPCSRAGLPRSSNCDRTQVNFDVSCGSLPSRLLSNEQIPNCLCFRHLSCCASYLSYGKALDPDLPVWISRRSHRVSTSCRVSDKGTQTHHTRPQGFAVKRDRIGRHPSGQNLQRLPRRAAIMGRLLLRGVVGLANV
jgi:hypothetical protein